MLVLTPFELVFTTKLLPLFTLQNCGLDSYNCPLPKNSMISPSGPLTKAIIVFKPQSVKTPGTVGSAVTSVPAARRFHGSFAIVGAEAQV